MKGNFSIVNNIEKWPSESVLPDIYYSFDYVNITSKLEGGCAESALYVKDDDFVFYPYCRRYINQELSDIITPYGYGGIITSNANILPHFYELFFEYCKKSNIVSQTIRFHPLLSNHRLVSNPEDAKYIRKTVGIPLNAPDADIFSSYNANTRNRIRQSYKNGLEVRFSYTKEDVVAFVAVYHETMKRVNAGEWYFFNEKYFQDLLNCNFAKLLIAEYKGKIVAGSIILSSKEFGHYHLAASKTEFLYLHPNHLLIHKAVKWFKSQGKTIFHLGGGLVENDSLYQFKKSFSNNNTFDFYLGSTIFLPNIYDDLVIKSGLGTNSNDFFPSYRTR